MTKNLPRVYAVILDLDNTLYDWVNFFVPAVRAMVRRAAMLLDMDAESLAEELRQVHVRHGNTEHPFALLETAAVQRRLPGRTPAEQHDYLSAAFEAFNATRAERLHLYPDVLATIATIRAAGCRVVGHTEATDVNIINRVRALSLQTALDELYAPRFDGPPHPLGSGRTRRSDSVRVVALPSGARKPDPGAAREILRRIGVPAQRCLYVGDSLAKDITMAKQAGMRTAWARYGTRHDPELWADLVRISHWDGSAVAAAESPVPVAEPDVILDAFGELLRNFTFGADPASLAAPRDAVAHLPAER